MPLSTSSSSPSEAPARRAIAALLALIALAWLVAEVGTRRFLLPWSRVETRTRQEFENACRPAPQGAQRLLLGGNSLPVFAVDTSVIAPMLRPNWEFHRVAVEQTTWLDWVYALPEFARRGNGAPGAFILMLDPRYLIDVGIRGDYSAFRLISTRDVIPFGREVGLHPTEISRLLLSRLSAYYGFRQESRKVLLLRAIPGLEQVLRMIQPIGAPLSDSTKNRRLAAAHLGRLRSAIEGVGTRFIFVLPPLLGADDQKRAVVAAGIDAGVLVLDPAQPGEYGPADFFDGYHMSAPGAKRFSAELAVALRTALSTTGSSTTR